MNRLGRPQLPAPWAICGSNSKQIDRGVPEIRDLGYFKRINGLRFWCLQNPLKIATFWDPPNFAKSCPANFAAVKKFRVRNNEHVAPSVLCDQVTFWILVTPNSELFGKTATPFSDQNRSEKNLSPPAPQHRLGPTLTPPHSQMT